jgi:indolepyruvate ferredoxin oxidoreductase alpha subunit
VSNVHVIDPATEPEKLRTLIEACLETPQLSVVIVRRNCLLAAGSIREYERCHEQQTD